MVSVSQVQNAIARGNLSPSQRKRLRTDVRTLRANKEITNSQARVLLNQLESSYGQRRERQRNQAIRESAQQQAQLYSLDQQIAVRQGSNLNMSPAEIDISQKTANLRSEITPISQQRPVLTANLGRSSRPPRQFPFTTPYPEPTQRRTAEVKVRYGTREQISIRDTTRNTLLTERLTTTPGSALARQGAVIGFKRDITGRPQPSSITAPASISRQGDVYQVSESTFISENKVLGKSNRLTGTPFMTNLKTRETTSFQEVGKTLELAGRRKQTSRAGYGQLAVGLTQRIGGEGIYQTGEFFSGVGDVLRKPSIVGGTVGLTLLATRSPKVANLTRLALTPVLALGVTENVRQIGAGQTSLGRIAGQTATVYGISRGTQLIQSEISSGITAYQTQKRRVAQIKEFRKLEGTAFDKKKGFVDYGGEGKQTNLFGDRLTKSQLDKRLAPIRERQIVPGLEKNSLKSGLLARSPEGKISIIQKKSSSVLPTGQTKLASDKIVAYNNYGQKTSVKVSDGKVFVKDLKLGKFVEFTPQKYTLFTEAPGIFKSDIQYNYFDTSKQQTLLPTKQSSLAMKPLYTPKTETIAPKKITPLSGGGSQKGVAVTINKLDLFSGVNVKGTSSYLVTEPTSSSVKVPISIKKDNSVGFIPVLSSGSITNIRSSSKTYTATFPSLAISSINSLKSIQNEFQTSKPINRQGFNIRSTQIQSQGLVSQQQTRQDTITTQKQIPQTKIIGNIIGEPGIIQPIRQPPPPPPPPIKIDFPSFGFDLSERRRKKGKPIRQKTRYRPSLEAITFNVRGVAPSTITPFTLRPITKKSKKKKKKKR